MTELAKEHPQEYPKGTSPLPAEEARDLAAQTEGWQIEGKTLRRTFEFKDFNQSFGFLSRVALLAEAEGHHPDMFVSWSKVELFFWTHTADGLTRNDFIMAARVNKLLG